MGLSSGWLQEGPLGIVVSTGDLIGETHLKFLILHDEAQLPMGRVFAFDITPNGAKAFVVVTALLLWMEGDC